jgi:hypothetical protein
MSCLFEMNTGLSGGFNATQLIIKQLVSNKVNDHNNNFLAISNILKTDKVWHFT